MAFQVQRSDWKNTPAEAYRKRFLNTSDPTDAAAAALELTRSPEERSKLLQDWYDQMPKDDFLQAIGLFLPKLCADETTALLAAKLLVETEGEAASHRLRFLQKRVGWKTRAGVVELLRGRSDRLSQQRLIDVVEDAVAARLPNVATTALDALMRCGAGPGVEDLRLDCLDSEFRVLVLAALKGLAELGSVDRVPRLREVRGPRRVREAAASAIEMIRVRSGAALPGSFAVVDRDGSGQLSVTSRDGQLSIAEPEAGDSD